MKTIVTISLSLFIFLLSNLNINFKDKPVYSKIEKFNPALSNLNTVDKLIEYIDNKAINAHIKITSLPYYELVNDVLMDRFYHGYSIYSTKDNLISASLGLLGSDIDAIVKPDDILKYPYAACSQQAIIFMTIAKRKKNNYRHISFTQHYCSEIEIDGKWYFFDTNWEPELNGKRNDFIANNHSEIIKMYKGAPVSNNLINFALMNPTKGVTDEDLAPNARLFHNISFWVSKVLFLFPIFILMVNKRREKLRLLHTNNTTTYNLLNI